MVSYKKLFSFIFVSIGLVLSRPEPTVYIIDISGVIDLGLAPYVERVLKEADDNQAAAVILEINTPGGRLDAALQIRDALFDAKVLTVAFVNREAASAGALITLACQKILMAPGSSIGAATPVDLQGTKASEKVVSYFRSVMRATAQRNHRPPEIAEAMVDEDVEIPGLVEKGKLLTLTTEEAVKEKFADHVAADLDEVLNLLNLNTAQIVRPKTNWAEKVVRFLTHPMVSSLLLTVGMLGLIYEVMTQGWGVGGTVGLIALALFFGSHYLVKLANVTEILIFIVGVILLLIEIFYIPGFGLLGISGIIAIIVSFVMSLLGHLPAVGTPDILGAITSVGISLGLTIVLSLPIIKLAPRTRLWNKLILHTEEKREEGFRAAPAEYEHLVGKVGLAASTLRPAGIGIFDGQRLDVVTEAEFIEPDSKIKIIKVEGNRIIVQKV